MLKPFMSMSVPLTRNRKTTMNKKTLTRNTVVQALVDTMKPLSYVHAFYEGGAAAFSRIDKWSDIDAYAVVDDEKVNEAFAVIEKALKSLSPIKEKLDVPQLPWPGVSQAFYRLEKASEFLLIDLAVLKLSCPDKFLEPEIHGKVIFHFNKAGKVKPQLLDKDAFAKKVLARLQRLPARFSMFNSFVQKEINRGNWIEALDLYYGLTFGSLVEILRIKYNPFHYDFKTRYVHHELPREVTAKLENLYFVKDKNDLQEKYVQASKWFRSIVAEIIPREVEESIRK